MAINDDLNGSDYEKQFTDADPDDSDTPGANQPGADDGESGAAAPAPTPVAAPAPAAPAAAPTAATGADPDEVPAAPAASPAAAPAVEAPAAAPAAEAPAAAPAPEPYVPEARAPRFEAPEDAQAQIDAARTKRDDAFAKFEEGELTRDEYKAIEKETLSAEQTLQGAITRDAAVRAVLQTQAEALYDEKRADAINVLLSAGIPATKENLEEFDTLTAGYGELAGRRGMVDGPKLVASQWALDSAVKAFKAAHGVAASPAPAAAAAPAASAPAAAPAAAKPTQAEAEAARKPDLSRLPPTLANTPAAADATITGNKFAHVDAMSRMDQEKAVASMTDAELSEYLK